MPQAKRAPRCALDMKRYAPGDRKFVLGVLELRPCPTLPERARDYVDAFLAARRELREAQKGMPGLRVDDRPPSRG